MGLDGDVEDCADGRDVDEGRSPVASGWGCGGAELELGGVFVAPFVSETIAGVIGEPGGAALSLPLSQAAKNVAMRGQGRTSL